MLKDTLELVKSKHPEDTELVYLSCDEGEEAFAKAAESMPRAVVVPYSRAQGVGEAPIGFVRKKYREQGKPQGALGEKFGVSSVPTLVVLDGKSGEILNDG